MITEKQRTINKLKDDLKRDQIVLKKVLKWEKSIKKRIENNLNLQNSEENTALLTETLKCNHKKTSTKNKLSGDQKRISSEMTKKIINLQMECNEEEEISEYNEKFLEQKYKRKYYDVIISGNGLNEYKSIYERIDEIERCLNFKRLEMILPIVDKKSKIVKLKVRVKNYEDYNLLIGKWPNDAFKTGVKVYSKCQNLQVIIMNIKKNFKISQQSKEVKDMCDKYGLFGIRRIHNHQKKPTNKIMARCRKIGDFIHILKHGIKFGKDKKFHNVLPNIISHKICRNCGSLHHQENKCQSEKRCLKCAEHGHRSEHCISTLRQCINCSGKHICFSDECELFSQKKLSINSFVTNILQGENFISNQMDILSIQKKDQQKKEDGLIEKVESLVENQFSNFDQKIEFLEKTKQIQTINLQSIRCEIKDLTQSIISTHQNLDNFSSDIGTISQELSRLIRSSSGMKNEFLEYNNTLFKQVEQIHNFLVHDVT